ncbi:MAG TPA: hypothetical protein VEY51_16030, partial [Chondromyces sp.]|nr:hypothetical protein [Chondromyces sp.]
IVDVIHGNNIVKAEPGHASGVYRADISEYVIGWIIGIEWYPYMVENTNKEYASIGDYSGKYFYTKKAQPFENWLAQQMDYIVRYEVGKYNMIRPMSFTNWVTTDILKHPSEPNDQEDLVSVNPNVIYTRDKMTVTNQFASYHIYPYYPDFFNYEDSYLNYKDHRGENNSYAAYLAELHAAHRLPILVAEFGVPSSRGLTHDNPFGWTQGLLNEKEQGQIISRLFEDIMAEKLLGGLIFTWQDEWFKRTWNTMDFDNPDRRPFWSNAQTNEQQFGLLSFDTNKIQVDGKVKDWKGNAPLYKKKDGDIRSMYVDHDERYLYIRLDTSGKGFPIILLDVVPNQGNHFIYGNKEITFKNGADFIINLSKEQSRILVDDYYDINTFLYAHQLKLLKPEQSFPQKNSGRFSIIQYALNRELYIPSTNKRIPFKLYETGKLVEGNGNPASKDYNSLADYYVNRSGMLEIRIPWLLIQAKDPSQKEFFGDVYSEGIEASAFINKINLGALYLNEEEKIVDSIPEVEDNQLVMMKGYGWEKWDLPNYQERLKQSYYYVRDLFEKY